MNFAIEARGLRKRFGDTQALDGVDIAVREGTVHGVLGPNGAGKTTAVRILATLLEADEGSAHVAGYDVARDPGKVRELIGLTGQYASVDELLTGRQNLELIGTLLDLRRKAARARAQELLDWFDLADAADRPAKTYSGGMRRRLDLAASLVGRPSVVFLDEPTTGLDPAKREDMWGVVRNLVADGSTVLLTTQYLEEADALADEITVIDHGRVIAHDTPDGLKRVVGGQTLTVRPADPRRLEETAAIIGDIASARARLAARAARSACRSPATRCWPRRSPASPRPASPSPSSPCTCPASTRSSSASPGAPTAANERPGGPRMTRFARHSLALAKRNLIGVVRNPEALIDVTLQPIIFIALFTYVFGGAIAGGSQHDYLQFLLPGILAQTIAFGGVAIGVNLNSDIEKGVFDRFRIAADRPRRAAGRRGARRRRPLRRCCAWSRSASATCSASAPAPSAPEVLAACALGDRASRCACAGSRSTSA